MGTQPPLQKKGAEPPLIFGPCLLRPNSCMDQDATWYGGKPRLRRQLSPSQKRAEPPPQLLAHVFCGQTSGWTKMPLGMDIGLGPGDFVFDGDSATPRKRAHPYHPIFGSSLLWPNGWMDQDVTCYGGKCRPRRCCV